MSSSTIEIKVLQEQCALFAEELWTALGLQEANLATILAEDLQQKFNLYLNPERIEAYRTRLAQITAMPILLAEVSPFLDEPYLAIQVIKEGAQIVALNFKWYIDNSSGSYSIDIAQKITELLALKAQGVTVANLAVKPVVLDLTRTEEQIKAQVFADFYHEVYPYWDLFNSKCFALLNKYKPYGLTIAYNTERNIISVAAEEDHLFTSQLSLNRAISGTVAESDPRPVTAYDIEDEKEASFAITF